MAGRGRGRLRKGKTRQAAESQVEEELPGCEPTTAARVSKIPFSETPVEIDENFEKQCSELKSLQSIGGINVQDSPSASSRTPLETVKNFESQWWKLKSVKSIDLINTESSPGAATSVSYLGLKGMQVGKRRPLQTVQGNGATPVFPLNPTKGNCDGAGTDVAVQRICDAIDAEVQVRSEVIRAIASAQVRSITSQLQLQLSRLPEYVQNMSLVEYLKSACPNIVSEEMGDGRIQLHKASSAVSLLRDSKKNLSDILSMARDNPPDELGSLFNTPGFGHMKTSVNRPHSLASEELSWPEFHAKLQALGHIGGYPASCGTLLQQDPLLSLKTGLSRGVTPRTVRIPKEGEALLSLNGSPLGQFGFTPGPSVGNLESARKLLGTRATRSTTKRSLRDL